MADINTEIHKILKSYFNKLCIMDDFKVQGEINYNRLSKIGLAISGIGKKDSQDETIISKLDEEFKNRLVECKNLFQAIDDCRNMPSIDSSCALWGAAYSIVKDFSEKYGNEDQYLGELEKMRPFNKKIILDDEAKDEQKRCASHIWKEYFGSVLHKNYEGNDFRDIAAELKKEGKVQHLGKLCDRIHYIGNDFIHASALSAAIQGAMISMIENMPVTTEQEKNDQEKALRLLGKITKEKTPSKNLGYCPNNPVAANQFWKKYFSDIIDDRYSKDNNTNSVLKGKSANYPNSFWLTVPNAKLGRKWYVIGTDYERKISNIFCIKASTFTVEQFDINRNEQHRHNPESSLRGKFEVCIDADNYVDQIKKEADFSDCLCAIADFNKGEIEWFNKDN